MNKQLPLTFFCLGLALACSDQGALDVGDETGKVGQALSDYAASWDGYAEAFGFPGDGDDRVRLTLDEQGEGLLRVGAEELFPAASDPNGMYPPTFGGSSSAVSPLGGSLQGLRSGFQYAVSGALVSGDRLKFRVALGQLMDSWCTLQSGEPVGGFRCGGDGGFSYGAESGCVSGDGTTPLDCDVVQQCTACECDADSCRGADRERPVEVDAALTDGGDTLEGTLVTPDNQRVIIRMTR